MISKQWRERLTYTAMSVFVGWHTLATVVAPGPDASKTVQSLRLLLDPYLTLFNLDHKWTFFAPVGKTYQLRYVIKDASGESHTFVPSAKWSWLHPAHIWFRQWDERLIEYPDVHGNSFAALFCREHTSLRPVSITFLKVEEGDFWPADHLNGKHRLDPEFVTVSTVKRVKCPHS
jgi:hypothetical protein